MSKPYVDVRVLCGCCGAELTPENTFGAAHFCRKCQSKYYKEIEQTNGCHFAIFICCAAFNVPCVPSVLPKDQTELKNYKGDKWKYYCELLAQAGKTERGGRIATFFDGVSSIRRIFGKNITETDFAKYIAIERQAVEKLVGTAEQRAMWGVDYIYKGIPFTAEIYNELDEQREIWTARYKGQTLTPQLENSITIVCKRSKIVDLLLQRGNVAYAAKVQKMVDDLMASEQMRRKDEKQLENTRLDAVVTALENAGIAENDNFKTYPEVVEALGDHFLKKQKYDYSIDVVDQLIYLYANSMRKSADMPLLTTLEENMQVKDTFGELQPEASEEEKERMRFANLTPLRKGAKAAKPAATGKNAAAKTEAGEK